MRSAGDGNQSIIGTKLVTLLGRSRVNFQFWPRFRLSLIGLGNIQYLHLISYYLIYFFLCLLVYLSHVLTMHRIADAIDFALKIQFNTNRFFDGLPSCLINMLISRSNKIFTLS